MLHCECGHMFPRFEERVTPRAERVSQAASIPDKAVKRDHVLFVMVALYLAFSFLRRLFATDEWSSRSETMLRIAIDLALAIGLIGLGCRVLKALPKGRRGRGTWLAVFAVGLVSLLGILALQINAAQRAERQSQYQAPLAQGMLAVLKDMVSQMDGLTAAYQKATLEIAATRWSQTFSEKGDLRALARDDLRDYLAKQKALIDSIDGMLAFLAEPRVVNDFGSSWTYAESHGLTAGRKQPDIDKTPWRLRRRLNESSYAAYKLVEENWEEWRSIQSVIPEAELNSWQREMKRLAAEARAAQTELTAYQARQ